MGEGQNGGDTENPPEERSFKSRGTVGPIYMRDGLFG